MSDDFEQREPNDEKATSISDSDALSNAESDIDRDPFEELASEFSERYRNGEMPSVEEYVERHPELAEEIRDLFPTIAAMEQLKERKAPAKPASGGLELEQLGDFRILGEIGRGGMGVVYEAEQVSLGRHVAVKVLPKQALLDERHLRRFEREAQTAAKLHHTNIVPVFGVGQQDGFHYIVMQFIPGVGLDEILIALRTQVLDDDSPAYRMDSSSRASHANHNAKALLEGNFSKHAATFASSFTKDTKRSSLSTAPGGGGGTEATMELPNSAFQSAQASSSNLHNSAMSGSSITNGTSDSEPSKIKSLDEDNSRVFASLDSEYYQSVAKIGQQVADALAYAHEQGTLHRDIKPGNLLLDGTGTVWVADFGLAKLAEQDNVSRTGDLVGTLSYMPPESFSGETDGRGDIYALGLTLYEMLAMRPAYYGRDRAKLVKKITEGDLPRLSKLNPSIPRDLETIVLKAIAHRPEDRYATARELEEDMQCFLTDMPIKARRMSLPEQFTRWCRKNKMVASLSAAVLSLLLLSSITFGFLYDRAEAQRKSAVENKEIAEQKTKLADLATQQADEARKVANEIATVAIGELFKRFNDIVSERLPLSTDQSLAVALSDEESSETLTTTQEMTDEDQSFATVVATPVTEETAVQAEKYLESFEVLASRTLKADEFAPIFADLTIRVGKIQRLLGNNEEALEKFDSGIEKYEAIVSSNPPSPSAIIGLANSYNEKGDVIAFTSHRPGEAFETFNKARQLFEKHEDLLADSPRATYERARMLFLMSLEYRGNSSPRFGGGGPGGGGPGGGPGEEGPGGPRGDRTGGRGGSGRGGGAGSRRGGSRRGGGQDRGRHDFWGQQRRERVARLQEAIGLLNKLVAKEDNPEYRYLLARCHRTVALNSSRWDRDQRRESTNEALVLLEKLVEDQPAVADYSFELANAKLSAMYIERPSMPEQEKIFAEIASLTTKIATANPAISNYAFLNVRVLAGHAETIDRIADDATRKRDDDVVELRKLATEQTEVALNAMLAARARFPEKSKSANSGIWTDSEVETMKAYTLAKQMWAQADSLFQQNEEAEAVSMLTSARNEMRKAVDYQVARVEFTGPRGPHLFESMKLLCEMEKKLSGPAAIKPLLKELGQQRLAAVQAAKYPEATKSAVPEFQFTTSMVLDRIGDKASAKRIRENLAENLELLVNQPSSNENPTKPSTNSTPEQNAKYRDQFRARKIYEMLRGRGSRSSGRGQRGGPEFDGRRGGPGGARRPDENGGSPRGPNERGADPSGNTRPQRPE